MTSEQDCWHALFSGELRKAAEGFEALRQANASVTANAGLFLTFVFAGSDETAQGILRERDRVYGDLGLLLWRATWIGAWNNLPKALDLLEAYLERTNAPSCWRGPLFYSRGHLAALAGNRDDAVSNFIKGGQAFAVDPMLYLKNDDAPLRSVVFQSMHMLTEETVTSLAQHANPSQVDVNWLDRPVPEQHSHEVPIIVAAADPHYMQLFGADFATSLLNHHPGSHIHLHIVDGRTDDFDSLIQALPASHQTRISGSLSTTQKWPVHKPPVYAGTRFLIAPDLLDHYQAPLLLLDIDASAKKPLDPLFKLAENSDLCCWVRPDGGAGGYTAAGAVAFSPGKGHEVAALTAAYIDQRLSEENHHLWFIDQAALFRAAHHTAATAGDEFKWGDFSSAGSFEDFFDHAPETPEKRR